jgi:hypothetical protein
MAKPYRRKPFPLYDDIADLVGGTRASGNGSIEGSVSPEDAHTVPTPTSAIDPVPVQQDLSIVTPSSSEDESGSVNESGFEDESDSENESDESGFEDESSSEDESDTLVY